MSLNLMTRIVVYTTLGLMSTSSFAQERKDYAAPSTKLKTEVIVLKKVMTPAQTETRCTLITASQSEDNPDVWLEYERWPNQRNCVRQEVSGTRFVPVDIKKAVLKPGVSTITRTSVKDLTRAQESCRDDQRGAYEELMKDQDDFLMVNAFLNVKQVKITVEDNAAKAVEDKKLEYGIDLREAGTLKIKAALNSKGECFKLDVASLRASLRQNLPFNAGSQSRPGQAQTVSRSAAAERSVGLHPDLAPQHDDCRTETPQAN